MAEQRKRDWVPWDPEQELAVWILYHPRHFELPFMGQTWRTAVFNAVFKSTLPRERSSLVLNNRWYRLQRGKANDLPSTWHALTTGQRVLRDKLRVEISTTVATIEHSLENLTPAATVRTSRSALALASPEAKRSAAALEVSYNQDSDDEICLATPTPKRRRTERSLQSRGTTSTGVTDRLRSSTVLTPVRRRRSATAFRVSNIEDSDEETISVIPTSARPRTQRLLSAVHIPVHGSQQMIRRPQLTEQAITPPEGPVLGRGYRSDASFSPCLPEMQFMVKRICGPVLWLKKKALETYHLPLEDVDESIAFPPAPALLFRYWDDTSYGKNGSDGFVAGRFFKNNLPVAAAPAAPEWSDLETHFSGDDTPTPFVSTCAFFTWTLRRTLQKYQAGVTSGQVAVIQPTRLPPRGFYYARPYFLAIRKKKPFAGSQWLYGASNEFLVWHQIPPSAISHTFSIPDLVALVDHSMRLQTLVQITVLTQSGDYRTKIIGLLEQEGNALTPTSASALGTLISFLGFHHLSASNQISHILGDLIRGLGISIRLASKAEWQAKAIAFDHGLGVAPSPEAQVNAKLAFLDGVQCSFGDWIYGERVRRPDLMKRRAKVVGLDDPTEILVQELEVSGQAVADYKHRAESGLPMMTSSP